MEEPKVTPTPRPAVPPRSPRSTGGGIPKKREGENRSRAGDGFLPFYTNAFDRVFISAVILIGIHLLWLRFMEPALPIEAATVISLAIGYVVVRRG